MTFKKKNDYPFKEISFIPIESIGRQQKKRNCSLLIILHLTNNFPPNQLRDIEVMSMLLITESCGGCSSRKCIACFFFSLRSVVRDDSLLQIVFIVLMGKGTGRGRFLLQYLIGKR